MSTPDGGFRAAPQLDLTAAMGAKWPARPTVVNVHFRDRPIGRPLADMGW